MVIVSSRVLDSSKVGIERVLESQDVSINCHDTGVKRMLHCSLGALLAEVLLCVAELNILLKFFLHA